MKPAAAKKALDAIGYDPSKGTRRLAPETRAKAKTAINALAKAGQSYKKKQAPKKEPKPLEDEG